MRRAARNLSGFFLARCFGPRNCRAAIDGSSLNVGLCDSNAVAERGRALFKVFDGLHEPSESGTVKVELMVGSP
jgi:hypothetical protein